MPEGKGTTMCLSLFKGKVWIKFILTVKIMAVGGEKRSKCQAGVALEELRL